MSDSKKSFILYLDQKELFEKLPDESAGKLIKHIFKYVNCEQPETDDLLIDVAFSSVKQALKRDLKKWEAQTEQRRQAGRKSAEKRANEKQRKATTVKTRSTKSTDSVNVSVNDNVSDSNKDICQQVADEYNKSFADELASVVKVTDKRKAGIRGCIAQMKGTDHDFTKIETWTGLFDYIKDSDFLMGRKTDWSMTFDFLVNKSNLLKIIEGHYENE